MTYEQDDKQPENEGQRTRRGRRRISENVEEIADGASNAVRSAIIRGADAAETIGDNIIEKVQSARSNRDNVVMVRVDKESLDRVDELVDAGIMNSRSEAAAFLITEGIKARRPLFDRIADKIQQIRIVREELRNLIDDSDGTISYD